MDMGNGVKRVIVIIAITLSSTTSKAHIVGSDKWCLAFSPFHQECVYKTEALCLKDIVKPPSLSVINEERPVPKDARPECFESRLPAKGTFFSP
jgi:hypothetical protein